MRETVNKPIDGFEYQIQQLGAKQGKTVMARMLRIFAPAAEASDPVARMAAALTDAELDFLCDTFAKSTQFSAAAKPEAVLRLSDFFDDHFAGRYGAMVKWLWACVEVNYGTFLADVGIGPDTIQNLMSGAKMSMTPVNPTNQTGLSGGSSAPVGGG